MDHYDAIAAHHAAKKATLTVEEVMNSDDAEADETEEITEGEGYQLVPLKLAKFIVTAGLSTYLKMLLVDNLMVRMIQSVICFTFGSPLKRNAFVPCILITARRFASRKHCPALNHNFRK